MNHVSIDDPFLSVEKVATIFDVRPATIRTWLKADPPVIKGTKIGKQWRIRQSEVTRFANEKYGENQ